MKVALSILCVALLLSLLPQPALSATMTRTTVNNDSDTWAWVTGYDQDGDHARGGSFCIAPGQEVIKEYHSYVSRMRFEFTSTNCAHPLYKDAWVPFGAVFIRFYLRGNKKDGYSAKFAPCHGTPKYCLHVR